MDKLKNYDTLLFSAMAFYAIYLFTSYNGAGISPDSIMYTSAARNFVANGNLHTFNHIPIVDFPVFYPLFLGIISFVSQTDPVAFGAVLNMFMFATLIFASGWIMSRFVPSSHIYKWLVLAAIILNPGLLQVYSYLWSETLFILEVLLFLIVFRMYLLTHAGKWLVFAAGIAAIACITRYAAVTIVGTGGLLLLLDRTLPIRKKTGHILIYGFVSISLLVANLTFNALHTGTVTGPREPSITSFGKNLFYFGSVFCEWIGIPPGMYPMFAMPLAIIILLGFVAALAYNFIRRKLNTFENLAITFALVYGLFIVLSATFSRYERINPRLLSPMYIPALWGYTSLGLLFIKKFAAKNLRTAAAALFIILMLGYITQIFLIDKQRYTDQIADDYGNPGYTDNDWMESEFANYLKHMDKGIFAPKVGIYSDAHEAVYFFSGMSSYLVPHKFFKKDVEKFYKIKRFYLIWFNNLENPELIDLKEIKKIKKLKVIKQFEDGAIYEYDGEDSLSQN
ncbi:hypothetical protein [Mucilaginibacter phyllosphaerae]|uniref:Glycosyltransferase RgtA/B/C/D-like domain-containing protein n=1 Tax=Mucilaginibacter phyllosphaerae TaxID=1812349 RepID=A0A4Y8A816_9SPHI|nr:hypothetical protein [Mucilaginibacter phyllosphaerae]MBB3970547.1 hypothetical protein [Mucilaginibacter phyllosphaerae]TEW64558.1 hypothetical protein E2R65_16190 [Mucilaginibacter phyllosphaerae]GGH19454.1 hypothetical protein GCM10007352_30820 [Mucilaginibacter phyllosphaerae]